VTATSLKNQWALITGASSGIGAATARALAGEGANVILLARRQEKLSALRAELAQRAQVETIVGDIRDVAATEAAIQACSQIRNISILVNNAGLARGADKIQDGDFASWREMIETNVLGLLAVTKACLPHLMAQPMGNIVNVGSVAGRWVYPGGNVYCATKFAVSALSEGLRMDLLGKNVRVTNIEPGMVETEFSDVRFQDKAKAKAVYAGMTPLTAEDIAESIVWSLSRPKHVNIAEMVIFPTDQASVRDVHRTT
jgi:3-hydroxy acid dehydrogenase/malonic semialdehyde reductase